VASALFACGCGANSIGTGTGGSTGSGGTTSTGGTTGTGGTSDTGGTTGTGGLTGTGGIATGGITGTGGHATGGTTGTGGTATGGSTGTGGTSTGGIGGHGTGGTSATGGTTGTGGSATGGTTGTGGSATGGVGGASGAVTVQLAQTEQLIQGFGINDNWGTQFSSTQADALFTTTGSGIGLSILRTGMSDSGSSYNSFEASQISTVKSKAGSSAKIIGSVWSPPASCKTNNNVNDGGHLMSSCYTSWSTTIANWASSNGLYAMSIGNEPDFASCGSADPCNGNYPTTLATATEMVAWVKAAKTTFMSKAPNVKIIAPEASEWLHTWSNVSAGPDVGGKESSDPFKCGCYPDKNTTSCSSTCTSGGGYDYGHYLAKDATAWAAFDILGVHQYDSQVAMPWPSDVNGGKPNKEVWQTEMSGVKWWPEQGPSSDINNGVAVAGWIHSALVDGQASAWLWWWYQASGTDDNEGLYLKSGGDTKRHYTLGNYSKFVRPGYNRVDITGTVPSGVLLSAFKGSDGTVVVVAINKSTGSVTVPISIAGGTAPASCTPWLTSSGANLTSGTAITVSGGSFSAALASMTVTSFVCK
jgi:glucuronoarabinoxylan endo-1,4-beta-xylanase